MILPDPDIETHDRLMAETDPAPLAASIMSAVVAYLIGSSDAATAAAALREWADEIQRSPTRRRQ
jgi:hypothetical protein